MTIKRLHVFLCIGLCLIGVFLFYFFFCRQTSESWSQNEINGIKETVRLEDARRKEFEDYFASLEKPHETAEQIIVSIKTGHLGPGFMEKVNWYVHQGNKEVINAVVTDYLNKCSVKFNAGQNSNCVEIDSNGPALANLSGCYGANAQIGPILHLYFQNFAEGEMDPGRTYLLLKLLNGYNTFTLCIDRESFKPLSTIDSVKKDVVAFLKTYLKFRSNTVIVYEIKDLLYGYKGYSKKDLDQMFRIADANGFEDAVKYFDTIGGY